MESALRLSYGTPVSMPLRVPSTVTTAQATKVQFSSSHSFLSLSTGSTSRPIGHPFIPVINAFDRSSVPSVNKGAHKIVRGTVGVSLDLACGLGVHGSSSRVNRKAIVKASLHRTSGKTALKSLFDVTKSLASSTTEPSNVAHLKMNIVRKMKSGKADEALAELRSQVDEEKVNCQQSAYFTEMTLVEFLICQGKFEDASRCDCLKTEYKVQPSDSQSSLDEGEHKEASKSHTKKADYDTDLPSDSRLHLYKAIIYTMLDKNDEAEKWWRGYLEVVQHGFHDPNDLEDK